MRDAQVRQMVGSLLVGLALVAVVIALVAARLGTTSIAEREAREDAAKEQQDRLEDRQKAREDALEERAKERDGD